VKHQYAKTRLYHFTTLIMSPCMPVSSYDSDTGCISSFAHVDVRVVC